MSLEIRELVITSVASSLENSIWLRFLNSLTCLLLSSKIYLGKCASGSVCLDHLFFSLFINFLRFDWSVVDLQGCVSFRCTAQQITCTCRYIHSLLFSHLGYSTVLSRFSCAVRKVVTYLFFLYCNFCYCIDRLFCQRPLLDPQDDKREH